jgi:hypothetical protein
MDSEDRDSMNAITVFGVLALTSMMAAYSLERRHRGFTLAFAFGCLLSSVYGFLIGAWPFGAVEIIWCGVALRKFQLRRGQPNAV